eukprot:scaffold3819_cov107-Isochrysis_galbana.AAC.14
MCGSSGTGREMWHAWSAEEAGEPWSAPAALSDIGEPSSEGDADGSPIGTNRGVQFIPIIACAAAAARGEISSSITADGSACSSAARTGTATTRRWFRPGSSQFALGAAANGSAASVGGGRATAGKISPCAPASQAGSAVVGLGPLPGRSRFGSASAPSEPHSRGPPPPGASRLTAAAAGPSRALGRSAGAPAGPGSALSTGSPDHGRDASGAPALLWPETASRCTGTPLRLCSGYCPGSSMAWPAQSPAPQPLAPPVHTGACGQRGFSERAKSSSCGLRPGLRPVSSPARPCWVSEACAGRPPAVHPGRWDSA